MRLARRATLAMCCIGLVTALASGPANATNWPQFGGDSGRSGNQVVDLGGLPVEHLYSRTGAADQNVRTSIITSGGTPSGQRFVYGTDDGKIHMRVLLTGVEVGQIGGTSISSATSPFGGGAGSVTPVETSSPTALGQVFVVHNDAGGVAIAQFDENTGNLVPDKDVSIPAAAGFTVDSSPVITAPDSSGGRVLFFIGHKDTGTGVLDQLFRVPIANASSTVATLGSVATTADINATNDASPTLVNLKDATGTTTPYVALGTSDGRLVTFAVADLAVGPASATLSDPVRTPIAPVGSDGTPAAITPVIYIAAANAATTKIFKVTQAGVPACSTPSPAPCSPAKHRRAWRRAKSSVRAVRPLAGSLCPPVATSIRCGRPTSAWPRSSTPTTPWWPERRASGSPPRSSPASS